MVKILYTTPILEHPAAGGAQISVETCIKALSRVSDLHVISRVPLHSIGGLEAQRFFEQYCTRFSYSPSARVNFQNKGWSIVKRVINRLVRYSKMDLNMDMKYMLKYADENFIDVLWCDRALEYSFDLICKIKQKKPQIKVVADTCAVYSRYILRELPYQKDPIRRTSIEVSGNAKKEEEKILVNLADVTTAVSEVDAKYFRSIAKEPERIRLFSNVVDVEDYQVTPPLPNDFKKPCIFLGGTFGGINSPMEYGARWLIKDILPLVRKHIPDIHLYVVGNGSDIYLSDIDDTYITITGKIPSVLPYLKHADVAIVPLKFESGTRFKIIEAGAAGIPVVSTTLGAEGLKTTNRENIIIADDSESFAASIVNIITNKNLNEKIGGKLNKLVRDWYSIDTLSKEASNIINYLT